MGFLKKQSVGFYINTVVWILALASLLIYVSNVNKPYYKDMNTSVVFMMVVALIGMIVAFALVQVSENTVMKIMSDVLRIAATVLVIESGIKFISMRVESFGYIFGSNLEMGNTAAFTAANQAVVGIIVFVVTWLLALIAAFFHIGKKVQK
jgi:membrane-associated HD superfamily phosphohydrolase